MDFPLRAICLLHDHKYTWVKSMESILIIRATFYEAIADELLKGAKEVLRNEKVHTDVVDVPGCFELAPALSMAASYVEYDGFVALGCVIRGETSHYDLVCAETARGLNDLAVRMAIPLGFGVITSENEAQARARADISGHNIGGRAAKACIQMCRLQETWLDKMELSID